MRQARGFLLNFTFLAAGDLAAKALSFLAFAHIARVIGTERFGDIAFAAALTLYFGLIVRQGLDVYAIQEVAQDHSRIRTLSASVLGLRLASSLAAAALLLLVVPLLAKPGQIKVLILLYGLSFFTSALSCQWVFLATEQMKRAAFAGMLGQLLFAALAVLLLTQPGQFLWIPVMQFTGELASTAYLLLLFRREFGPVRATADVRAWSVILKDSLPMGFSGAMSLLMYNFDIILLGFFKPASEVGQYSAAYKIITFFLSFVLLYSRNLLPSVSRCRGNPKQLQSISRGSQKYVLVLTIPLATGGTLLARSLMQLVFGGEFTPGAAALQILIWIIPIASSRVLFRATLLSHGLQNDNLRISLAAAAINVALNGLLIPRFSYLGSAVASVVSELALLVLTQRCVTRRVVSLPLAGHLWRPVLASIVMTVFLVWYHSAGILVRTLGGFLVYLSAGIILRAFDIGEIRDALGCR